MIGLRELINRLRHNRGYGVQSPAAFFFVMHVLRKTLPYYAYPSIKNIAKKEKGYSVTHCQRIFRIVNHINPKNIILLTDNKAIYNAIHTAKHNAEYHIVTNSTHINCKPKELEEIFKKVQEIGLIYIEDSQDSNYFLQKALPHVNKNSVIIVEGIRRSKTTKKQWNETIANPQVIISMDLYNYGILFFNPQYKKQNYTFLFK